MACYPTCADQYAIHDEQELLHGIRKHAMARQKHAVSLGHSMRLLSYCFCGALLWVSMWLLLISLHDFLVECMIWPLFIHCHSMEVWSASVIVISPVFILTPCSSPPSEDGASAVHYYSRSCLLWMLQDAGSAEAAVQPQVSAESVR